MNNISLKSINIKLKNVIINHRWITITERNQVCSICGKKIDHKDQNLRRVKTIVILQENIKVQLIIFVT